MPSSPTGGISIFINIAILLVGALFKYVKKMGIRSPDFLYSFFVDKKYDYNLRRILGFTIAILMFSFVAVTMLMSIKARLTDESNYDLLAPKISEWFENKDTNILTHTKK